MRPALALVLLAAVIGGGAQAQDHAHHDHGQAPASAPAEALYTADDLAFLHHMIVHHRQAVEMGALMPGRTERPEFVRFGGYVADAQRAEIEGMQALLDAAAARGLPMPAHTAHADPPMAGMLSAAEMKALAAARGAQFERLWLQGMIFHHDGGLAMARAQELRQALEGRQPFGLQVVVDDILASQRAEITRMAGWLQAWGLATTGDGRAPDVEVASPAPGSVLEAGRPATLLGVAVDDTDVAAVEVAVHDLTADRWLRRDGSWGEREPLAAELIGSGPASAAWRLHFTPPSPGRFAVFVEAQDIAGKPNAVREPWTVEAR